MTHFIAFLAKHDIVGVVALSEIWGHLDRAGAYPSGNEVMCMIRPWNAKGVSEMLILASPSL